MGGDSDSHASQNVRTNELMCFQAGLVELLPNGGRLQLHWENKNSRGGEERGQEEVHIVLLGVV